MPLSSYSSSHNLLTFLSGSGARLPLLLCLQRTGNWVQESRGWEGLDARKGRGKVSQQADASTGSKSPASLALLQREPAHCPSVLMTANSMLEDCLTREESSQQSLPQNPETSTLRRKTASSWMQRFLSGVTRCFWIRSTHPIPDPVTVRYTVRIQN